MELTMYKMNGEKGGKITLPESLFAVTINPGIVHEAILTQEANSRVRYAQTKDRSEVAGTGKKPWKQKGTGRARHGSRRSPIWIGGGITFGPIAARVFGKKINKKAKTKALMMALTDKVNDQKFIVVEDLTDAVVKTKDIKALRGMLPVENSNVLFVAAPEQAGLKKAIRNLEKTDAVSVKSLNVRDVVKFQYLVLTKAALDLLIDQYSK